MLDGSLAHISFSSSSADILMIGVFVSGVILLKNNKKSCIHTVRSYIWHMLFAQNAKKYTSFSKKILDFFCILWVTTALPISYKLLLLSVIDHLHNSKYQISIPNFQSAIWWKMRINCLSWPISLLFTYYYKENNIFKNLPLV